MQCSRCFVFVEKELFLCRQKAPMSLLRHTVLKEVVQTSDDSWQQLIVRGASGTTPQQQQQNLPTTQTIASPNTPSVVTASDRIWHKTLLPSQIIPFHQVPQTTIHVAFVPQPTTKASHSATSSSSTLDNQPAPDLSQLRQGGGREGHPWL